MPVAADAGTKEAFCTRSTLKQRGWTESAIARFLDPHDREAPNPHYRKAAPMRLYRLARVEAAEQSDDYRAYAAATAGRRTGAKRAAATKRERLLAEVEAWRIEVPAMDLERVRRRAIRAYNDYHEMLLFERGHDYERATLGSDRAFLDRITVNYLRHELTPYDDRLRDLFGRVGTREGYAILNRKIHAAIAAAYPDLIDACDNKIRAATGDTEASICAGIPVRMFGFEDGC